MSFICLPLIANSAASAPINAAAFANLPDSRPQLQLLGAAMEMDTTAHQQ